MPSTDDFLRHRFVPSVIYARETGGFHTRLCIYNYFSELFPDVRTGVSARLWAFDQMGAIAGTTEIALPYQGQLQFECREFGAFEGTAAVALVPDTLPKFSPPAVATGYYALYYDEAGHADFSHEWDPMRMIPMESAPWICVVRPLLLVETEIIVMNSCFGVSGEAGASRWSARLRDGQGRVLAETPMPDIPPRGSARVGLSQVFPNVRELASSAATLAFEATGCNIMGPFSFVRSASGDFNIHHFC